MNYLLLIPIVLCAGCMFAEPAAIATAEGPYQTFAIVPALEPAPNAKPAAEAVEASLVEKGYSEAAAESADLLVNLRCEFRKDALSETTEIRTMYIEVFDRRRNAKIWMDRRERSSSQSLSADLLQKEIGRVLDQFPAPTGWPAAPTAVN